MKWIYLEEPEDGLGETKPIIIHKFNADTRFLACRHIENQKWRLTGGILSMVAEWYPDTTPKMAKIMEAIEATKNEEEVVIIGLA